MVFVLWLDDAFLFPCIPLLFFIKEWIFWMLECDNFGSENLLFSRVCFYWLLRTIVVHIFSEFSNYSFSKTLFLVMCCLKNIYSIISLVSQFLGRDFLKCLWLREKKKKLSSFADWLCAAHSFNDKPHCLQLCFSFHFSLAWGTKINHWCKPRISQIFFEYASVPSMWNSKFHAIHCSSSKSLIFPRNCHSASSFSCFLVWILLAPSVLPCHRKLWVIQVFRYFLQLGHLYGTVNWISGS